ncbi:unnamed protein product [Phytophthora lilii]|uniref:Unnamed protein product n=1 Tax=Phytophthora lilii TaxID=2077276 RepID=A0A9W6U949_9STRA|nr:unnamed protein product [Phytophthora lilii]
MVQDATYCTRAAHSATCSTGFLGTARLSAMAADAATGTSTGSARASQKSQAQGVHSSSSARATARPVAIMKSSPNPPHSSARLNHSGASSTASTSFVLIIADVLRSRYPVLVFQADVEAAGQGSLGSRKRRRPPSKDEDAIVTGITESTPRRAGSRLYFFFLSETEEHEIYWRFVNAVEVPSHAGAGGDGSVALSAGDGGLLHIFLVDGPYVLVFNRCSQSATLLKLERARGDGGPGFYVWREKVEVRCDLKDTNSASIEIVSCTSLASYVLPAQPAEVYAAFNHVGHAYVGNFSCGDASEVLLLNYVPGVAGSTTGNDENTFDDGQLVKRSVLITQKAAAPETKLSCHRLRLRDENKSKHTSRSRKRSRADEKASDKDGFLGSFHYIERTQKASTRDRSASRPHESTNGSENTIGVSLGQLDKMAKSLRTRLDNGLQELERLHKVMRDKCSLAHQLNQIIIRQWQQQQVSSSRAENPYLGRLMSIEEIDKPHTERLNVGQMETIISASAAITSSKNDTDVQETVTPSSDIKVEQLVRLEYFCVLEYIPSTSHARAEVVLNNLSGTTLEESFVVLTPPCGQADWTCLSSVVPEISSAVADLGNNQPGRARFYLELHFTPSFKFLRVEKLLVATLWLQVGALCHGSLSISDFKARHASTFALAVGSVKISAEDLLRVCKESPATRVLDENCFTRQDQNQLLFISSGTNLPSWLSSVGHENFHFAASIVRPTFALVSINARSRALMQYEVSRMVASLPPDVYVMQNPFERQQIRTLQCVLRAMHQEGVAGPQQNASEIKLRENGGLAKQKNQTLKTEQRHRVLQQNTDLQVNRMMQALQRRANFHTMWFDAAPIAISEM